MLADANRIPEQSPSRQRLTGVERRAAIVRAAVDLFSQRGFRGTTTRELASAVGVSEPVLYQHFATKRDLYTAIVDHLIAETTGTFKCSMEALGPEHSDRDFFHWLGTNILKWYANDTKNVRLLLFSALEGHELSELWHERAIASFIHYVEEYVSRRVAAGDFVASNPLLAARAFIGTLSNYGLTTVLFPCKAFELPQEDIVSQFVDLYLNGIRTREFSGAQS